MERAKCILSLQELPGRGRIVYRYVVGIILLRVELKCSISQSYSGITQFLIVVQALSDCQVDKIVDLWGLQQLGSK